MVNRHPDFIVISTASTDTRITAAREWLMDCFGFDYSEVHYQDDDEIVDSINRFYYGGWSQFVIDGCEISD